MTNSKTIISYNGGSAGDLFTLSCNGERLEQLTHHRVVQPATLKNYEHKIKMGENVSLFDEMQSLPYQFVSTHMLDELIGHGIDICNIVISDKDVQHMTVCRQLQLQKLQIQIDHNPLSWYTTIKRYCATKSYSAAAGYWFEKSKQYWIDRMNHRLNFVQGITLNFNMLYTEKFVDHLEKQGWAHNIELLRANHTEWLKENTDFTYEKTVKIMAEKMATMNWDQTEGWIVYNPN